MAEAAETATQIQKVVQSMYQPCHQRRGDTTLNSASMIFDLSMLKSVCSGRAASSRGYHVPALVLP